MFDLKSVFVICDVYLYYIFCYNVILKFFCVFGFFFLESFVVFYNYVLCFVNFLYIKIKIKCLNLNFLFYVN